MGFSAFKISISIFLVQVTLFLVIVPVIMIKRGSGLLCRNFTVKYDVHLGYEYEP